MKADREPQCDIDTKGPTDSMMGAWTVGVLTEEVEEVEEESLAVLVTELPEILT